MTGVGLWAFVRAAAVAGAVLATLRGVKLAGHRVAAPSIGDLLWAATLAGAPALAGAAGGPAAYAAAATGVLLLVAALWLDAVMWRAFTAELGPGAVGSIVLSIFARELGEVAWVRRFFRRHLGFAALPAVTAAWLASPLLPGAASPGSLVAVFAASAIAVATTEARAHALAWLLPAAAAASFAGDATLTIAWPWLCVAPALLLPARLARRRGLLRASLAGDFLRPRPWPPAAAPSHPCSRSPLAPRPPPLTPADSRAATCS